jgi:hypothetical protein
MTTEQQMSYEPAVGDKVRFLMDTYDNTFQSFWAKAEDVGTVAIVAGDMFRIDIEHHQAGYVYMHLHGPRNIQRIPHDLMRIKCYEPVPTPCENQVDIDAVMRRCGDKPSCHDVELKVLTVMQMCRELRRYRLEEKARKEDETQ